MLSVPTLWVVIIFNFLAMGLVWVYVTRAYPKFEAARYWAGASLCASTGASITMLRGVIEPFFPLVVGGSLMVLACCLAAVGVRRFYDAPASWRMPVAVTAATALGLSFFVYAVDDIGMRIVVYSIGQAIGLLSTLKLMLGRHFNRTNPGARLACSIAIMILGLHVVRSTCAVLQIGGPLTLADFNGLQTLLMLLLVFLSLSWNFAFLLMAVDRLRNEVADLALLDDLTGVGNRRYLMQRMTEECARSERSGEAFALLVIDLDGFKTINDTYGHAAGDACLQHFTLMAQTRLRPGDMLARAGGDEFCIVLPGSTLREGAMIAERVLQVCRDDAQACTGVEIPIAVSIGVAEWTREVGAFPDRLVALADQALYAAKKEGKNRYALYDGAPSLAPGIEAALEAALFADQRSSAE
ncbi:GGDEF domain-containing protein [Bradyrhizobium sp. STM 3557]|uniref:GGDEF domain-containing protein n=1 Tax=Bradyrhizobium sp. STM 3557 TaxID=578920 RepID=UPI00388DACE7